MAGSAIGGRMPSARCGLSRGIKVTFADLMPTQLVDDVFGLLPQVVVKLVFALLREDTPVSFSATVFLPDDGEFAD